MHPLLILAVGIASVIGLIVFLRVHAFLALIISALLISFLAPGDPGTKVERVAMAFGKSAGDIGIVIALASIIGICMMESGAADRVVRAFLSLLGEKRGPLALTGSGYVLAMPVFFDTVFYLLVPLARSLFTRTGKNYLLYLVAIAAGGAITHTMVPPTPGPLLIATQLNVDLGLMILLGLAVALPASLCGLAYGSLINKWMPVPMREVPGMGMPEPVPEEKLPPLYLSLLPVLLPVLLITSKTIVNALAEASETADTVWHDARPYTMTFGDSNLALLLSAIVALALVVRQKGTSLVGLTKLVENALMSGGVIILITAAGGAFGKMLGEAGIGNAIKELFVDAETSGLMFLLLGFGVSALLKLAQGSSTVAMMTASPILAGMIFNDAGESILSYHQVYVALAIGSGSLIGSWMNDSGFWVFAKMGGLTEVEALKSWTPLLLVLGSVSMLMTTLLAIILPLQP